MLTPALTPSVGGSHFPRADAGTRPPDPFITSPHPAVAAEQTLRVAARGVLHARNRWLRFQNASKGARTAGSEPQNAYGRGGFRTCDLSRVKRLASVRERPPSPEIAGSSALPEHSPIRQDQTGFDGIVAPKMSAGATCLSHFCRA